MELEKYIKIAVQYAVLDWEDGLRRYQTLDEQKSEAERVARVEWKAWN